MSAAVSARGQTVVTLFLLLFFILVYSLKHLQTPGSETDNLLSPQLFTRTLTFGTAKAGAMGKSMGATAASAKAVRKTQHINRVI